MILPGATLGILGGGQLGRMFAVAARTMGYRVIVLDPDPDSPAAQCADEQISAGFSDRQALEQLGKRCAAVSTEFENVPADTLCFLAQFCPVRPGADAVAVAQDRITEKSYFAANGFPCARFAVIRSREDVAQAVAGVGTPALLKVSQFGYDGKGQARVNSVEETRAAFEEMGSAPCVLEELLPLELEVSVVLARGADGQTAVYPVAENQHQNGILDVTIVPARIAGSLAHKATQTAVALAERLNYCGVLTVEFFVLPGERLLINEMAPRPHNSGHYTLDACVTSQFEQQVRALCGLPLGDTRLLTSAVMVNLLGDLWGKDAPQWQHLLTHPQAKLHLYGKREARLGRKMGHYTCVGDSVERALEMALEIKAEIPSPTTG
ncbi:MAG: 5-(carboxyamino)imidazole ribonucleotide synthase [Gammaproteobacteria bacterium]|nr:5-(carboxyamino)imidazole ribonucleotide synthase [Gammaproteobacteria bacterium]